MESQILQNLDAKERAKLIKDNSVGSPEMKEYLKRLSDEELTETKDLLSQCSVKINDLETEKKAFNDAIKLKMKPLAAERSELINLVKTKHQLTKELCYKHVDYKERQTAFYNAAGIMIECRPATPDDLQLEMPFNKAANE